MRDDERNENIYWKLKIVLVKKSYGTLWKWMKEKIKKISWSWIMMTLNGYKKRKFLCVIFYLKWCSLVKRFKFIREDFPLEEECVLCSFSSQDVELRKEDLLRGFPLISLHPLSLSHSQSSNHTHIYNSYDVWLSREMRNVRKKNFWLFNTKNVSHSLVFM